MVLFSKFRVSLIAAWYAPQIFSVAAEEEKGEAAEDDDDEDTSKGPPRPAHFMDTPQTTELWKLVSREDATKTDAALENYLFEFPAVATARSNDGRGGLWWAWE